MNNETGAGTAGMKKVLVVDDENLILYSLSKALSNSDIEVKTAGNGKDALREIRDHAYDLCILDICLPDTSGVDIMKTVNRIAPGSMIIVMTANEVDEDMMKDIRKHASLFLRKPFDLAQVRSIINQMLIGGIEVRSADGCCANHAVAERRKHQRITISKVILGTAFCHEHDAMNTVEASLVDISIAGIGITTDCRITAGDIVRFSNGVDQTKGIVRWDCPLGSNATRAGIEFVG